MFLIIIVAIVSLPIWLVPFGPIIWTLLLIGSLINHSSRKSARVANRIADRQSKEMRAVLRVTNPEAAEALDAEDRAAQRVDRQAFRAAVGLLFLMFVLGYYCY
jgi:hypothetical protein